MSCALAAISESPWLLRERVGDIDCAAAAGARRRGLGSVDDKCVGGSGSGGAARRHGYHSRRHLRPAPGAMQVEALRSVGLAEETLSMPIGNMSGGQFQRLLIAFALLGRPNVLLLD